MHQTILYRYSIAQTIDARQNIDANIHFEQVGPLRGTSLWARLRPSCSPQLSEVLVLAQFNQSSKIVPSSDIK